MDELLRELRELNGAWSRQEDDTLALFEALAGALRGHRGTSRAICVYAKSADDIDGEVRRRLAQQGDSWKSLHAQISKYSKAFEKRVRGDFVDLVRAETSETQQDAAITSSLLQHFYREGNFEVGDALADELDSMADAKLKAPFEEMHGLIASLQARDIRPAVAWAQRHQPQLGTAGLRLQFQLHSLAYTTCLRTSPREALAYARQHIAPFAEAFRLDLETLMGALAFAHQLEASPYHALLLDDLWGEAEEALVAAYCRVLGLPRESALRLCLNIGTQAWPKISRVLSLMRERPGVEWNPQEELPVEVDTGATARFHSVFVCPVLRQQTTETNPPMMMPCGHVICQEALNRLCKGNQSHRIKCPYCPAESTASMAQRIAF